MAVLTWDQVGERLYETGVDRGVLYLPTDGVYDQGYSWNGLTAVTESPSGAEPTPLYADNIKYLNLISTEEFAGTIEAFTYPDEFAACDGTVEPHPGLTVGQQARSLFGLSYRTKVGTDLDPDEGYKYHLIYGALAAPSEKAYATVNDSPEAITFSWEFSTTPVSATGLKPTSILTVDTTKVDPDALAILLEALHGTAGTDPRLPLPDEVASIIGAGAPTVVFATAPTFVEATGVITIPSVTGVRYRRADTGVIVSAGAMTAIADNATLVITAEVTSSAYALNPLSDDDWSFTANYP